ncbi:hypothetical protein [Corynebacterium sp. HMSC072A02]|uniref:ApeA N-terminal domain 1-containing protein n=1 Tax=Corynebacterium sp. HMSC072A02 TaxID=1715177 RepID=UPI0008A16172|nr:hypothetical protein [Corynebacterium sp. HMSC072A02]OFM30298.1 hypothetical protein HMPREF2698_03160 [Corynebacterium sp. HMSC072A02]
MNTEYLKQLRRGEHLSGFLMWCDGEETFSVPGVILLEKSGQVVIRLILHSESPVKLGFEPGTYAVANGVEIKPILIPEVCSFDSNGGVLTLVQSRSHRRFTELIGHPVELAICPRYVIASHIESPHWKHPVEMRAEIEGLDAWICSGIFGRSISVDRDSETYPSKDRVTLESFDYQAQIFSGKASGRDFRLRVVPLSESFRGDNGEEIGIRFRSVLEVSSQGEIMTWDDALKELRYLRELLMLLAWKTLHAMNLQGRFGQSQGCNKDFWESIGFQAPEVPPVGDWADIFNSSFSLSKPSNTQNSRYSFIIPFHEFDQEMLDKWRHTREYYSHPIQLFIQTIDNYQMAPEVKALQLGAGIESLGFKVQEKKTSIKSADGKKAIQLFRRVEEPARKIFPHLFESWSTDANEVYQAMKHLNRELSDTGEIAKTNYQSILVIQIWLAHELGASESSIKRHVEERMAQVPKYSKIEDPSMLDDNATTIMNDDSAR